MLRTKAAEMLDGVGAFDALLKMRRWGGGPWITVLTYHRVGDPERIGDLDDGVVDARTDAFDRQVGFLREHFTPITLAHLEGLSAGAALPPNPVLITFDDGYRDNHDVVLPILKKHDMSAVFFIATDFIARRRLFWWDKASVLMKRARVDRLEFSYPRRRVMPLTDDPKQRARVFRTALAPVKAHFGIDIEQFLDDLSRATGVTLSADEEAALVERHLMTWDHVRALRRAGMAVQSHTRTHRILGTLDERALDDELGRSREELEGQLGERVTAVAYPVGKSLACAPQARRAIRRAGYRLGFSNGTGLSSSVRFDPIEVKRLSVEVDLPDAYFRGMVSLPLFAYEPHAKPSDYAD